MNSIVNHMHKYDHRQHVLSDWLAELEQRFQLGEVDEDKSKITWCQLLIGATGSSILSGLEDDASWETAKETLLSRLGIGSVKDEAWAALKHLKKGSKEIVELAGEAEKFAKRLHPHDEEAAERHAIDTFPPCLSVSVSVTLSLFVCFSLSVCLFFSLSVCLSVCPSFGFMCVDGLGRHEVGLSLLELA